jgi:hypothetical protein
MIYEAGKRPMAAAETRFFSSKYSEGNPFLSPDGERLFFIQTCL